jgi:hypothetical protein
LKTSISKARGPGQARSICMHMPWRRSRNCRCSKYFLRRTSSQI